MEDTVKFACNGKTLFGILHVPEEYICTTLVVLMVTGGPQTRIGSHRLYVQLARFLCENGIIVFRFDYEGLGDSEGDFIGFSYAEQSIDSAIEYLKCRFSDTHAYVIWGLCDGASISAIYSIKQKVKISGLILCNPIVHFDYMKYNRRYYRNRILSLAFWSKFQLLRINFIDSFREVMKIINNELVELFNRLFNGKRISNNEILSNQVIESIINSCAPIKLILSDNDVVADEFLNKLYSKKNVSKIFKKSKVTKTVIKNSDHTFSDPAAKKVLFKKSLEYIYDLGNTTGA